MPTLRYRAFRCLLYMGLMVFSGRVPREAVGDLNQAGAGHSSVLLVGSADAQHPPDEAVLFGRRNQAVT